METPQNLSCLQKQFQLKKIFNACACMQKKYEKIIELGKSLPPYPEEFKTPSHLVPGCQSILYLHAEFSNGKIHFQTFSEALISAGLAALLLFVYNDESPETILKCPPQFLEEIGISANLSPSRSNGLASLFKKMQQISLNYLMNQNKI